MDFETPPEESAPRCRFLAAVHTVENTAVCLALGLMTVLPLAEIVIRKFANAGIAGSTAFVQHFTLVIGMLGGAIAARQGRLLALSTLEMTLKGAWKAAAHILSGTVGGAVTLFLFMASLRFLQSEREAGKILAYGIPFWTIQLVLPVGFAAVGLRILWRSSEAWRGRLLALVLGAGLALLAWKCPVETSSLRTPALLGLVVATALGAPLFVTLGGAALILFWTEGTTISAMTVSHYDLVTNPSLPTIPLFTLAGYFLAEGGASRRLIRVFQAVVGSLRGGPAIVTALACAFFTSFTGASGVTILALGALLMPVLRAAGYSERTSLGLLTGAGSLGLLFPPCLPLILYAVIAHIPMENIFLGGIVPGCLLVGMTAWWGISQGPKDPSARQPFDAQELKKALWDAKWELALPVVALAALFSGVATPVEASAVTALYAFIIETFVYRDLKLVKDVPRAMTECCLIVGSVLLILGVAMGLTNYLVDAQIPTRAMEWTTANIHSRWLFLLLLNVIIFMAGGLMEIYAAIVVVVPLVTPLGAAFGIDPVHLGIIILANLEIAFLAPPAGINLLLASYRFNKPFAEVCRAVVPMLLVFLFGLQLITYIPPLTTFLPRCFGR